MTAGSTYFIRVGGYDGGTGPGTFSAEVCEGKTVTVDGDTVVNGTDLGLLIGAWGRCAP